ncbi:MAG TPA: hypothetical protein VNL96_05115 [Gemmatimonadaceae bacterium]|nr:hypothetical protein [Gemmatimonadaceae bacterium]
MNPVRQIAATAAAVLMLLALRAATLYTWETADAAMARLRLSWSARPERVESCRTLSDAELSRLPAHMRLRTQCSGRSARYLLSVAVADSVVYRDTVRGGGLRHDRPIHIFDEFSVPPRTLAVRVSLTRLDSTAAGSDTVATTSDTLLGARAMRELDERRRRAAEAVPPHLVLDTIVHLEPRAVLLVAYDERTRRLVALDRPRP